MQISVDFTKPQAAIKPMHGVGQPPFQGINFDMFKYLKDASIPYSRLHDVGGAYGGFRWVDIPNIFRNFEDDEYSEESYDFAFTDLLIKALIENGVEPFFRLGVTIENYAKIKAYRIYPPKDPKKWAVICEHIIRHYTEGWANGFFYDIKYWEIWNEPDNFEEIEENCMWRGTKEEYYELYTVASKHLKSCFPHLKIGGYASCGFYALSGNFIKEAASSPRYSYFITFLDGFLDHIKKEGAPIDFFSWHSYDNIKNNIVYAEYARARLTEAGFPECEILCNEWNTEMSKRGTARHAAVLMGMLIAFQRTEMTSAMFYDAGLSIGVFGSLFNPLTKEPFPAYYAFYAFGELYRLGCEVQSTVTESDGVYALAARNDERGCIVIANTEENDIPLSLDINGKITKCITTDSDGYMKEDKIPKILPKNSITVIYTDI